MCKHNLIDLCFNTSTYWLLKECNFYIDRLIIKSYNVIEQKV